MAEIQNITKEEAKELVLNIPYDESTFFTVVFVKKDKTLRTMNCRRGVKKHLRGGELGYNAKPKGLLSVFDVQKKGYRMINCETIKEIKYKGQHYKVV